MKLPPFVPMSLDSWQLGIVVYALCCNNLQLQVENWAAIWSAISLCCYSRNLPPSPSIVPLRWCPGPFATCDLAAQRTHNGEPEGAANLCADKVVLFSVGWNATSAPALNLHPPPPRFASQTHNAPPPLHLPAS